jgi:hypothetical protein
MKDSMIILDKLGNLIEDKNNSNEYNLKRIKFLKHSYLSLIPYSIHNNNEDILNTTEEINEEKGRITTFYFIENILKIFLGAIKYLDAFHPLDYIIQSIGCNIIELNDCEEKYYIEEFLKTTGAEEITNIFKITESINDKNFNPNKSIDRYIFCHGTKSENILGILSEGIKISPVQAASTGITLTASHTVIFTEFGQTCAQMEQACDRIHRIGQIADRCLIYYLLVKDTVDEAPLETLTKHYADIQAVMNGDSNASFVDIDESMIAKVKSRRLMKNKETVQIEYE